MDGAIAADQTTTADAADGPSIAIADNSHLVLVGLDALLSPSLDIVVAARSFDELQAALRSESRRPDVVLVELRLLYEAEEGAFVALDLLARDYAVVVTAAEIFPSDVLRIFAAEAKGVVVKDERPEKLLAAIAAARSDGERYIDPRLAKDVLDNARKGERGKGPFGLTIQELRVARQLADDHTNAEIARRFGISVETVKIHIRSVVQKLGAYDRVHAARIAATLDLTGSTETRPGPPPE